MNHFVVNRKNSVEPEKNVMLSTVRVLSAGAVGPGVVKIIDAFERGSGHKVNVTFATAPVIRERIGAGDKPDVVIAPLPFLADWLKAGRALSDDRVTIGRVGVGVMVRAGAPLPNIASVDEFKQCLLNAESVIYNQASTGIFLERLFHRLGIQEQLESKTTRYPDAAAVLRHVSTGKGTEIGLAATTVIKEAEASGIDFVGPLPAEIQNYTSYAATVLVGGAAWDRAREFVRYIGAPAAKKVLAAAGIE